MNIFILIADQIHALAIISILVHLWTAKGSINISGKSQILLTIVYITRYLDLVFTYFPFYIVFMRLFFIVSSLLTLFLIYVELKTTNKRNSDESFRIECLIIPSLLLALFVNYDFISIEVLWAFSIYLESVAILPQVFLVFKTGEGQGITCHYLFLLTLYRGLYMLNWIYRYFKNDHYDVISITGETVQVAVYCASYCVVLNSAMLEGNTNCSGLFNFHFNEKLLYIQKLFQRTDDQAPNNIQTVSVIHQV